jgi:hypothetical protein
MTSVSFEKPVFIQLDIPSSPLLLSLPSDPGSLFNAPFPPPCTTAHPEMTPFQKVAPSISSSSSSSSLTPHPSHSVPGITVTRPLSELAHDETSIIPFPHASPPLRPRISATASNKLVGFVDLLDKIDRDMAAEVEHVKESIREAREYVEEWREERSARKAELLRKMEREKRETTKELDTNFWRGV